MSQVQAAQGEKPAYLLGECDKYLKRISAITGRNAIAYYSGWLRTNAPNASIVETDKNAFMNAVYGIHREKGVDIILHTPGGDIAATESIVAYLHDIFNNDVRAIVPQIAMSAGTMIAMSCKEIMMGRQSSLGPIDPQINGIACQMVIDEFYQAIGEVKANPASLGLWQAIISKYNPTYLTVCKDAVEWSKELAEKWLKSTNPQMDISRVEKVFINHKHSHSHSRHISKDECRKAGLPIVDLEENQNLQDAVLSFHHCCMILFESAPVVKYVVKQGGRPYIQTVQTNKR